MGWMKGVLGEKRSYFGGDPKLKHWATSPVLGWVLNVRTKVRTFLRSNGNSKQRQEQKTKCGGLSTPLRSGRDDGFFWGGEKKQQQRQELAGKGCAFPNRRPIRRAQDGAPRRFGLFGGEQTTAKATAKAKAKAKAKYGVLRCAQNDAVYVRVREGQGC